MSVLSICVHSLYYPITKGKSEEEKGQEGDKVGENLYMKLL